MHCIRGIQALGMIGALILVPCGSATAQQSPAASQPTWPMYRGNPQRTGVSPFNGPLPMRVHWQVDLGAEICAAPAIGPDGVIYVGAGVKFYAVNPAGEIVWSHDFAARGDYSRKPSPGSSTGNNQAFFSPSPALTDDGTIYQPGSSGHGTAGIGWVFALESRCEAPERIRWGYATNREMRSSPLMIGGNLFVGDAMLLSLDGGGNRRWTGGRAAYGAVTSSPAVSPDGATLYIGDFDGRLHAIDSKTGVENWTAGPEGSARLRMPHCDERGSLIQGFTTAGYVPESPAVGADGTIYFGSWDGHLYAAAPDGKLRRRIDLKDRVTSAPALAPDGRVLVCTYEGRLICVNAMTDPPVIQWQAEAANRYSAPLVSADGQVYVGTLDGRLRAYALTDGRLLDELALGGWVHASPVPGGDGLLYVGASDGFLRAIVASGESRPTPNPSAVITRPDQDAEIRLTAVRVAPLPEVHSRPADYDEALRLARAYLEANDPARRGEILDQVAGWGDRLDDIARALRPAPLFDAPTGLQAADKFRTARVRSRMEPLQPRPEGPVQPFVPEPNSFRTPAADEEYLNWVHVPESYDPSKPMGLVISLHGGAGSSPQSSAAGQLQGARRDFGDDFILVSPSTPPLRYHWGNSKFCIPESELHFQSIIEDYSSRYAIDPDRVYLTGFSMGGIGSWWHTFRQADRFAVIAPQAGMWRAAYWPKVRGTLIFVMNGAFDHHCHVDYARHAHSRMTDLGIPHIDAEFLGSHNPTLALEQREALAEILRTTRRDPYARRVCAVAPFVPETRTERYPSQPYSFWVGVLEAGSGSIPVDYPVDGKQRGFEIDVVNGRERQRMMKVFESRPMKAGAADAENLGGNRFRVRAANVKRFVLWLHPKMGVDFTKPIEIELIRSVADAQTGLETELDRKHLTTTARPSLGAMLEYLGERRDFGLIYHAKVVIESDLPL